MNQITSFKILIGSLYKSLTKASIYGKLKLRKLYILDIINEFLYDCPNCINHKITQQLQTLAISIQNSDDNICKYREQRSIYTNIVGCKDCNPNNSSLIIVNTAPTINNPDPIEPDPIIPPKTCANSFNVPFQVKEYYFSIEDLSRPGCFIDQYDGYIKNIKIKELPINGILSYNNLNVEIDQIIDLDDISTFKYISLNYELDSFKYIISGSVNPLVFNEQDIVNIFLINE